MRRTNTAWHKKPARKNRNGSIVPRTDVSVPEKTNSKVKTDVHVPENDSTGGTDVHVPELDGPSSAVDVHAAQSSSKKKMMAKAASNRELIAKRQVSQKQRDSLASSGKAMKDGSFPIANVSDLKNAIQANGRAKDPEKAKKFIMRRAKALGQEELIPTEWLKKDDVVDAPTVYGSGQILKADTIEDEHLVFGWAQVIEVGGKTLIDRQNDFIDSEAELEKAAYDYMLECRIAKDNHDPDGVVVSKAVESVVFTTEKIQKMGLPDDFPRGWWVGFKVEDEAVWEGIKKDEYTGFSIHGTGLREEVELDEDTVTTIGKSDITYSDMQDMVRSAFADKYCDSLHSCYVRDMTDTWAVVTMYANNGGSGSDYYKIEYSIDGTTISLGDPVEVVPAMTYREVTSLAKSMCSGCGCDMGNKKTCPECGKKVVKGEPTPTDVHQPTGITYGKGKRKKGQTVIPVTKSLARNRAARERVKNG